MKYKNEIFERIDSKSIRLKLALALNVTEQSIRNAIKLRRGILLQYPAMLIIKNELSIKEDDLFDILPDQVSMYYMNPENKNTAEPIKAQPFFPKKITKEKTEIIKQMAIQERLKQIK